jgi:hypothetical protein
MAVKKGAEAQRTMKPGEKRALAKSRNTDPEGELEGHDTVAVDRLGDVGDILKEYCEEYRVIVERMAKDEERRKELSEVIFDLLKDSGFKSIYGDTWKAVKSPGSNTAISATKLAELGVDMDIIEQATVKVKYEYLQVRKYEPKAED